MLEMDSKPRISGEKQHAISVSWSLNSLLNWFVFFGQEFLRDEYTCRQKYTLPIILMETISITEVTEQMVTP